MRYDADGLWQFVDDNQPVREMFDGAKAELEKIFSKKEDQKIPDPEKKGPYRP